MAHAPTGTDLGRLKDGKLASVRALSENVLDPGFLRAFLAQQAWFDMRVLHDDFEGDTINLDNWIVNGDSGTTNFAIKATNTAGRSTIVANTAADTAEIVTIYGHCNWLGDKNCGIAIRWMLDDVTDVYFEMGFCDPLSDYTDPAINDIDTPTITNGAINVAMVMLDTSQTLTTAALVTDGDSTYATQKVNLGTWAPTAGEFYTTVIQIDGDDVFTFTYNTTDPRNPVLQTGTNKSIVSAFEGGTLVEPRVTIGNRTTDGGLPEIDFIRVWSER